MSEHRNNLLFVLLGVTAWLWLSFSLAGAAEPPPLPLHAVEGAGGVFSTLTAYLVNPPSTPGEPGKPSFGATYIGAGHGRNLTVLTLTESVGDRVELGYARQQMDLGDLPSAIYDATDVRIGESSVTLQQLNARVLLLKENAKSPALTLGLHYKTNSDIASMNRELGGALRSIGVTDDSGWDYTLYASKLFTTTSRPVLVSAGLRSTRSAHTGLLGFTHHRSLVAEGSVCVFVKPNVLLAAEYRQKPNEYTPISGLIGPEDDWWTLCAAYIVNPHLTIAGGYAHFGQVLNHSANRSWGLAIKYEL